MRYIWSTWSASDAHKCVFHAFRFFTVYVLHATIEVVYQLGTPWWHILFLIILSSLWSEICRTLCTHSRTNKATTITHRVEYGTLYPVDNFGTVVGENPTPYWILALWAVNGLSSCKKLIRFTRLDPSILTRGYHFNDFAKSHHNLKYQTDAESS